MFVQILKGKVRDPELFGEQARRWGTEIKPNVTGFLGATWGLTADQTAFVVARFESPAAAHSNSDSAGQAAWYEQTLKAFDAEPTFRDTDEVDLILGGGSDRAGFVQVMEGRVKDKAAFRATMAELEADVQRVRPDVLGATVLWHDGTSFTQVVYFASEAEARRNEATAADDPTSERLAAQFDGDVTFYDLATPAYD